MVLATDGSSGTPVTLSRVDDDGRYRGAVELPGSERWTVRFTSIDPTGTIEASMAAATPETVPGSSTAPRPPPRPPHRPPPTAAASEQGPSSSGGTGDDGRGVLVASGIAAVAIVVVGSLVFRRIQQRDQRRDREAPVR